MDAFFEITRESDSQILIFRAENNGYQPHFHSNLEFVYVVNGEIEITINGQTKTLTKGCLSISNSYDIHSVCSKEYSDVIVLIIPINLVKSFSAIMRHKTFSKSFYDSTPVTQQIYYILNELLNNKYKNELTYKGGAYYILGLLYSTIGLVDKSEESNTDLAREILVFLQNNYTHHITIDTLSKEFGYNKNYLSGFFNSYLKCGFNSYLNTLRSRHAVQLIANGQTDLNEIAYTSGFNTYRTFNRAFMNNFNITPSEYMARLSEE